MACRLVGTKRLSEPILILLTGPKRTNFKKNYRNLYIFIQENPIQDVWKIAAISRPQCVEKGIAIFKHHISLHYIKKRVTTVIISLLFWRGKFSEPVTIIHQRRLTMWHLKVYVIFSVIQCIFSKAWCLPRLSPKPIRTSTQERFLSSRYPVRDRVARSLTCLFGSVFRFQWFILKDSWLLTCYTNNCK